MGMGNMMGWGGWHPHMGWQGWNQGGYGYDQGYGAPGWGYPDRSDRFLDLEEVLTRHNLETAYGLGSLHAAESAFIDDPHLDVEHGHEHGRHQHPH